MKKLIFIFCALILSISAFADSLTAMRGKVKDGYNFWFYNPDSVANESAKPLVIFLHGIGHADYVDAQLDDSDFPYWASQELQSKFDEGGAFILLPRSPEHKLVYWNTTLIEPLRAVIDDMIAKHGDNIDTTKIFIGGSSAGGEMTWNMAVAFPSISQVSSRLQAQVQSRQAMYQSAPTSQSG